MHADGRTLSARGVHSETNTVLSHGWSKLGPAALLALACSENSEPPAGNDGAHPSGGAGTTRGGTVGVGATTAGGSSEGGAGGAADTTGPEVTCTIAATSELSARIPTVGIVTFTTDLADISDAHVDFGRDEDYGMTAPVDLAESDYRTLLLGMKPSTTYHYRIVVRGPSGTCTGPDATITTGARANGLPALDVTTQDVAALSGGFLVTGQYQGSGGAKAPAYIIDADGDIVWWFITGQRDVTNARMSYDGKFMWIQNANVPRTQGAVVHRVSMDGMTDDDLSNQFTGANHQFAVLPDETVAFYAYGSNDCDDIKERAPDGTVKTLVNAAKAQGTSGSCHINHIEYSPEDDTLIFSDLDHDSFTKIRRSGQVVWVLGGSASDFTGSAQSWSRQHGLDVLGLDRFVFFNNGGMGEGSSSAAVEILLDLGTKKASRPWTYTPTPAISNQVFGDVQRMENGNTVIAYSTQGMLHEVSSDGELVQEINWALGAAFGYIEKRQTLYGQPSR